MSYTASDAIARIKLKAWTGASSSLTDAELLNLLNDALRSYVVPFLKAVRDEWFVSGYEEVTCDANARLTMPNSVASTIRTISWTNNGQPTPLTRIEPEAAFAFEGNNGSSIPYGYVLRGYGIQILPTHVGSQTFQLRFMERPAEMVLEEDAGQAAADGSGFTVTLSDTPLAWQSAAPATVDIVSNESPYSVLYEGVEVTSIVADVVTFTSFDATNIAEGMWLADPGASPYPNVPIELHPLLELDVMRTLFEGLGDKRLDGIVKRQMKMEGELRKTLAPRTQGNARPLLNRTAPGANLGRWWAYGR